MSLPNGPYNPQQNEDEILKYWLENKFYKPEYSPVKDQVVSTEEMKADPRKPFSIICPPPNAYGRPHLGNISGYAYQDAMGRYARMKGKKVLLLPGKDHAGLEGEGVFVRDILEKKGVDKFSLSREEFYNQIWEFNMQNKELALKDEQTIGLSADFDRDIFTLDPKIVEIVLSTFIEMFNQNMIYKGVRIVNWDPKAQSVIADNQCVREERKGKIYRIKYPIVDDNNQVTGEFITVATTRPETMFGDTAVAVNPTDERYTNLVGRKCLIPLTNTIIPIITSPRVEKEFGTGCLKITPAHSLDDFTIMTEWNQANQANQISYCNVINKDLTLVGPVPSKYLGKKYIDALPEILSDLKSQEYLISEEELVQNVLIAERTKAVVEPIMSSQWFIDIEKIRQPVIDMVKNGDVTIHPKNMEAKFFYWMENLRDWAISRTLWWGYRMPVWYVGSTEERIDNTGKVETFINLNDEWIVLDPTNENHLKVQLESPGQNWKQEESVLDTWFSSGQWPYATLMVNNLMDTFYPTSVMETGYDILENWVSRMMMFSYFKLKKAPFKDVYLHGLVKGTDGQKMSKSKGNVIPMDEAKEKYGVDPLRMVYFYQNSAGGSYSLTYEKLEMFKNFNNKIWNASKFVLSNFEKNNIQYSIPALDSLRLDNSKEIFNHITDVKQKVTKFMDTFKFGLASSTLYDEFWHNFCDKLIEQSKVYLYTQKNKDTGEIISEPKLEELQETVNVFLYALKEYTKMLHPFIPFITEKIWQELPKTEGDHKTVLYSKW